MRGETDFPYWILQLVGFALLLVSVGASSIPDLWGHPAAPFALLLATIGGLVCVIVGIVLGQQQQRQALARGRTPATTDAGSAAKSRWSWVWTGLPFAALVAMLIFDGFSIAWLMSLVWVIAAVAGTWYALVALALSLGWVNKANHLHRRAAISIAATACTAGMIVAMLREAWLALAPLVLLLLYYWWNQGLCRPWLQHLNDGLWFQFNQDKERAERHFAEAVRLAESRFGLNHVWRGRVYLVVADFHRHAGKPDQAAIWFQKAEPIVEMRRRRAPLDYLLVLNNWAICLMELHQFAEAEQLYRKALQELPTTWVRERVLLGNNLGWLAIEQGKWEEARGQFASAYRLVDKWKPDDALRHMLLRGQGKILLHEDCLDEALCLIEDTLTGPDAHDSQVLKADILRRQGKLASAEREARAALQGFAATAFPDHPDGIRYWTVLALCLAEQGRLTEAETWFAKALEVRARAGLPDKLEWAQAFDGYAHLLRQHGDTEQALALEEQARNIRSRGSPIAP